MIMTRRLMCLVCPEISFGDCFDKDVQVSLGALGVDQASLPQEPDYA